MSNEAFDDVPDQQQIGAFGLWRPGMDLMVRLGHPGKEEFGAEHQARFIADLKALANAYDLIVKDWGPTQGMVSKVLMEGDDLDHEQRLRDVEQLLVVLCELGPRLPPRLMATFQRISERVQGRA